MNNVPFEQFAKQYESMIGGPSRAYGALALDYVEKLVSSQFEATRASVDAGVGLARSVLDIKDPDGLRSYVESQQKVAQSLGERLKGDAEKVVAINQEFVEKAQKLAESNAKSVTKAAAAK